MVADKMTENWKQKWGSTKTEPHDKNGGLSSRSAIPAPSSDAMAAILMTTHCICIKEKLHMSTGGKCSHPQVYGTSEGAFM